MWVSPSGRNTFPATSVICQEHENLPSENQWGFAACQKCGIM